MKKMSALKDFIRNWLKDFIGEFRVEESKQDEVDEGCKNEPVSTHSQVIDPKELRSNSPKKDFFNQHKKDKQSPIDKESPSYWWDYEGKPETEAPVFEILQDDRVAQELNRKIDSDEFPVIEIPGNVMKTMEILNKPDFEYSEVSELIRHSPAMTGEFIKTLNSALFYRGEAITDLKLGLPRLGKDSIKAMLYMYSSKMSFSKDVLFNNLAKKIVEHCYSVALIASHLGQTYYANPDEAFLAGLLHDIGKLGILKALTETYELPEEIDFEMTEELFDDIFPELHEKAGAFLAKDWKIDNNVIFAIEHHHDFATHNDFDKEDQGYHLSALVNISDTIARMLGNGRTLGKTNLFDLPAAQVLSVEKDNNTIEYLADIPQMLKTQTQE